MSNQLLKLRLLLVIVIIGAAQTLLSAQPYYVYQKIFYEPPAGNQDHIGYEIQQTSDRGFVIGGLIGVGNFYLIKTDALGALQLPSDIVWEISYGKSIQQTSDGGYIMAGYHGVYEVGGYIQVVKYTATRQVAWQVQFDVRDGVNGRENFVNAANCIRQTSDGGYILTGYTIETAGSKADMILVKLTSAGTVSWIKQWKDDGNLCKAPSPLWGLSVEETADGGYIIAGERTFYLGWVTKDPITGECLGFTPSGNSTTQGIVVKTNSSGNEVWRRVLSEFPGSSLRSVQQTSDGNYVATGYVRGYKPAPSDANKDVLLIKFTSTGTTQWCRWYRSTSLREEGYSVKQTSDGGFIIAGMHYSPGPEEDALLIKVNSTGQVITWAKTYGYSLVDIFREYAYSVVETFDATGTSDGYALTGYHQHIDMPDTTKYVFFVRTSPAGNSSSPLNCAVRPVNFTVYSGTISTFETLGAVDAQAIYGGGYFRVGSNTAEEFFCDPVWATEKRSSQDTQEAWTIVGGSIDLALYPNPVGKGEPIRLKYRLEEGADVGVVVTDLIGRTVYSWQGMRSRGEQQEHIVPNGWQAGWYTINVSVNGVSTARSMVLIR